MPTWLATLAAITLAGALLPAPAGATAYTCRNRDYEVICNTQGCKASEGFTPMRAEVDVTRRTMTVCAYSGCWAGRADALHESARYAFLRGDRLRPVNPVAGQGGAEAAAVVVDRQHLGGSLLAFGFVQPMSCTVQAPGAPAVRTPPAGRTPPPEPRPAEQGQAEP